MTQTDPLALGQRSGLPDALRVLMEKYPRTVWQAHPNFGELVRFWMDRHLMFRQLVQLLREDAQGLLDKQMAFDTYAQRLSHYGGTFLNQLHGHHQIEDAHYFPKLIGIDPRLERGFDLLETDHEAIDPMLHDFAGAANAVLQGGEVGALLNKIEGFETLLDRHLIDEEEIVVPVILESGFQG